MHNACNTFGGASRIDMNPDFWLAQRRDLERDIAALLGMGRKREADAIAGRLPMIDRQLRIIGKEAA